MTTVLKSARPTARKPHWCDLCGTRIEPGEIYDRQTNAYDGRVYDWLTCLPCLPVFSATVTWVNDPYRDEGFGTEDADDWAREYQAENPDAAAYLARREAVWEAQRAAHAARRALAQDGAR